jgi:uncharacterized protein YbcV (DUF1398 family)
MNMDTIATIEHCARSSKDGSAHFGEIVRCLVEAGVESYFADYRGEVTTYYLPDGQAHAVPTPAPGVPIADAFDVPGVQAAIRGAQTGDVMYPEFMRLSRAAEYVGYFVWLAGRHVAYYGRRGEVHKEMFPS